ncbi:hypothetical protein KVR01_012632 [Diaporthe batatas]|uniref:uncharacterized protein n=1 Tax=Diaporthe batatas TaxID=748121 RepID=UPI001D0463DF|nr:uncharacterized protein KVR01_012632 [Diaporthe batatas]KAG8157590.1 hypothetical protein KVR01_012632 [Diaporthe batatas]
MCLKSRADLASPGTLDYQLVFDQFYRPRIIMASTKENNTNPFMGPGLSLRTRPANTTNALSLRDGNGTLAETTNNSQPAATHDGVADLVTGSCSTCGSAQHDTARCDSRDPPPELTMSGALQRDPEGAAAGDTRDADEWRAQAFIFGLVNAQHSLEKAAPGQGTRRRNSM